MRRSHNEEKAIDDSEVYDLLGRRAEALLQRDDLRPSVRHIHLRFSILPIRSDFGVCNDALARPNIKYQIQSRHEKKMVERDLRERERTQKRSDCCWGRDFASG